MADPGKQNQQIKCSSCGKEVEDTVMCSYQKYGYYTCRSCCEKCYESEPFPCSIHDNGHAQRSGNGVR